MPSTTPSQSLAVSDLLADGIRYERGGVVQRARECFETVTRQAELNPAAAAEAWWHLANLHRLHSSWDAAIAAAHQAADLARTHGFRDTEANALNIEGAVWWSRGELDEARALFERMLDLASNESTRAKALQNLGSIAAEHGDLTEAQKLLFESREAYLAAGDQRGEATSLLNIGRVQMDGGDLDTALVTLESAVNAAKVCGDLEMLAAAQLSLGIVLGGLGRINEAEERITTAYGQFTIADIPTQRVWCLMQLATLAVARDEKSAALICLEHARTVAESAQLPRELRLIDERIGKLTRG